MSCWSSVRARPGAARLIFFVSAYRGMGLPATICTAKDHMRSYVLAAAAIGILNIVIVIIAIADDNVHVAVAAGLSGHGRPP
jgi:hypothetical protein